MNGFVVARDPRIPYPVRHAPRYEMLELNISYVKGRTFRSFHLVTTANGHDFSFPNLRVWSTIEILLVQADSQFLQIPNLN